jgi:hypothetical protein
MCDAVDMTKLIEALYNDLPAAIRHIKATHDIGSDVILTGHLGNALVEMIGIDGTFCALSGDTLYEIRLVPTRTTKIPQYQSMV